MAVRKTPTDRRYRKKWEMNYRDPNGRRLREYFDTRREADERDLEIKREKREGRLLASSPEMFKPFALKYLDDRQLGKIRGKRRAALKPSSERSFRQIFEIHLFPAFGPDRIQTITRERTEDLEHQLALAGAAEKTRRNILNVLAAVLDHAIATRLIDANPALRVHLTRPEHGEIDWEAKAEEEAAESEEAEEFIAPLSEETAAAYTALALSRYKPTQPVRAFLIEALWTGKRRGELLGGRWKHYEIEGTEKPCVHVRLALDPYEGIIPPKTKAARRTIPLPPIAARTLLEWKLVCPDRSPGAPVYPMGFSNAYKRHITILKKIGVPRFKLHDLRDCFASLMAERGVRPATLKYLMGHENEATTAKFYRRPTWDGIEHAREAISRPILMDVQGGRAAGLS